MVVELLARFLEIKSADSSISIKIVSSVESIDQGGGELEVESSGAEDTSIKSGHLVLGDETIAIFIEGIEGLVDCLGERHCAVLSCNLALLPDNRHYVYRRASPAYLNSP